MNFAIYSQTQSDRTISIRIERHGAVLVFVKSLYGEVIRSDEIAIDPQRAAWIVDALKLELPYLHRETGSEKAAVAWDDQEPHQFVTLDTNFIDSNRFPGIVAARELLERTQVQGRQQRAQAFGPEFPSRNNSVEPVEVVIAAVSFFAAHFAVALGVMLVGGLLLEGGGVAGLIAWAGGILVAVGATYFVGGYLTAKLADGNGYQTAMYAAFIAVGINVVIGLLQGNGAGSLCIVWLLPFLARFGASTAGSHPPH